MSARGHLFFWVGAVGIFCLLIWALAPVLLPFVVGMAIAYLLDPVVDRLDRRGISRPYGTALIMAGAVLALLIVGLALFPLLREQVIALGQALPDLIDRAQAAGRSLVDSVMAELTRQQRTAVSTGLNEVGKSAVTMLGDLASRLWSGGLVVVDFVSIMLITPVVVFYLLRDWEKIIVAIDGWLPRPYAPTIREQARLIDRALAGFVRGQLGVCLISGTLYALGWTLAGLNFGLIIGLVAGFLAFIPYVGGLVGLSLAMIVGVGEVGFDWVHLGSIFGVYLVVQGLEGTFIQPRLVGRSVGLHDLWIVFALLAGGALFGFLGVLLAVPAAAAIGVLVRFGLQRYLASRFYRGDTDHAG
ncbi:AI-2E family transporter [Zavarzinia aquatilis]|uniref:AI-2E family transporter n=1 Tax=Zavarzinia aquatilis TaxID=2211142 RepID=A0A317E2K6_9PROT|nr:AI-2E family transporter [Zavarzinia aquatilis]PWR19345.1 AI-2E family transporter [Zavarzinia aquatilis]